MEAWYKAGFLFPFLRNHNVAGAKDQEPWTRGAHTERIVGDYIRSRYKLLPYLYQYWIAQEESGDPVMRPLWLHWPEEEWTSLCGDQFMIGAALLHAPILEPGAKGRALRLPDCRWFDWGAGAFVDGGAALECEPGRAGTPLYMRAGYGLPMQKGRCATNAKDLRRVDIALFAEAARLGEPGGLGKLEYLADDGESLAYRRGGRSGLGLRYAVEGELLSVDAEQLENGYGSIRFRLLVPESGGLKRIRVNGRELALKRTSAVLAGRKQAFLACGTLGSAGLKPGARG
jgi:alpha-glucosidase